MHSLLKFLLVPDLLLKFTQFDFYLNTFSSIYGRLGSFLKSEHIDGIALTSAETSRRTEVPVRKQELKSDVAVTERAKLER